uniref:V-type ATP synthase subunit I n=1 Tax=Ndongobacter massiliensis TaxID=1871025 RepID=UPI0009313F88|nr:V-type ATPase 116kDa subunit family protein [Ndongobacter massiliensis]
MAVEKMSMVQVVGRLDRLDEMVRAMFGAASMELVDAQREIEHYSFTIDTGKENLTRTLDMNHVTTFEREDLWTDLLAKWPEVMGREPAESAKGALMNKEEAQALFSSFEALHEAMQNLDDEDAALEAEARSLRLFSAKEVELADLSDLVNFSYAYGTLTEAGRRTIRGNYENIPAAVLHLGQTEGEEAYFMLYPLRLAEEIQRLKDSLNWKELPMPQVTQMTNEKRQAEIEREREALRTQKEQARQTFEQKKAEKKTLLATLYATLVDEERIEQAKAYMAHGSAYFYLAGWVPNRQVAMLQRALLPFEDRLVKVLSDEETALMPPTKLHNGPLVRPFEALIHMYGTPNYREIDPTAFFALTYLLLFGAMFGDFGQGAVFALAGGFLLRHRRPNLGGVILRVGLSSMVFGLLYGSVFGNETLLPALLIKPFQNINTVLLAAIAFGVALSSVSYVLGIVNRLRAGDLEEGLFGKEGVTGFVLYLSLILAVLSGLGFIPLPTGLFIGLIGLCLALLLFKQPLANLLRKKRHLYEGEVGSYYVESGFSLIEALISIFSGVVSFIRVGAFAINHVGLFMAFETMGEMMGGSGQVAMLIVGNIVILGLEGLIVFIQSLRLEYYEMFSKYYVGDGHPFTQTNA